MAFKPWLRLLRSSLRSVRPAGRHGAARPRRGRGALELEGLEHRYVLSTFFVTTTADSPAIGLPVIDPLTDEADAGTLRAALEDAEAHPGFDTIKFKIPTTDPGYNGQWWTIKLGPAGIHPATPGDDPRGEDLVTAAATALPVITDGVLIDGLSQASFSGNTNPGTVGSGIIPGVNPPNNTPALNFNKLLIAIDTNNSESQDGSNNCFQIEQAASNVTIRGLSVYDAGNAIKTGEFSANTATGSNRLVDQMFLGVLPDGLPPSAVTEENSGWGVRVETEADAFSAPNPAIITLTVTHSFVGFNGLGGLNAGQASSQVDFEFNEVFENGRMSDFQDGIDLDGSNSIVRYNHAHDNRTATATPNAEGGNGIEIGSNLGGPPLGSGNTVEYNTTDFNSSAGISIVAGSSANLVRFNAINNNVVGITVDDEGEGGLTHLNQFNQNKTFMNLGTHTGPGQGTGIDLQYQETPPGWFLAPDGSNDTPATGQDPGDGDTGSNDLQNHPTLNSAVTVGNNTNVQGALNSLPNTKFNIEFFRTPDLDSLVGNREGEFFIGQVTVVTDLTGTATFNVPMGGVSQGDEITATATQVSVAGSPNTNLPTPGNTSEYSNSVIAAAAAGKVTGGGWYYQPVGAVPAPTAPNQDRANFGFNAKYQHSGDTVPQGHTNFAFRPQSGTDLHFESTSYDPLSLVVTTEPVTGYQHARWSGEGKLSVNGGKPQAGYFFKVNVTDRGEPGTADSFRIQIRNQANVIIYDNGSDATETTLNGGNIQVHMPSNALEAADGVVDGSTGTDTLTDSELAPVVQQAVANWSQTGLPDSILAPLSQAKVQISHLSGSLLGLTAGDVIAIDPTAAGHGWSLDPSAPLAGRMDLLTVVTHELGHLLGVGDLPTPGIMFGTLPAGVRIAIDGTQATAPVAVTVTTPPTATLSVTGPSAVAAPTPATAMATITAFIPSTPSYTVVVPVAPATVSIAPPTVGNVATAVPLAATRSEVSSPSSRSSETSMLPLGSASLDAPKQETPVAPTEAPDTPVPMAPSWDAPVMSDDSLWLVPGDRQHDAHDAFFSDEGSVHDLVLPDSDGLLIDEENGTVVSDAALALAGLAVAFTDLPADAALAESERRRRAVLKPPAE